MKLWRKAANIFDGIIRLFAVIAAVILVLVMSIILYEIVMRYFLNRPTVWVLEYSELSLVVITFLGTTWLLKEGWHTKMDIVLTRFTPRTQTVVNVITSIMSAIVFLIVAWYGAEATRVTFMAGATSSSTLAIPQYPILLIIPVGSFLLFIQFLRRAYGFLKKGRVASDKEQGLSVKTQGQA